MIKLFQHLPPHSSEKQSLFTPAYKRSQKFMNQGGPNASFKEFEVQDSACNIEK